MITYDNISSIVIHDLITIITDHWPTYNVLFVHACALGRRGALPGGLVQQHMFIYRGTGQRGTMGFVSVGLCCLYP